MDAEELAFAGIARQAELIRAGEVSSRELVELYLERIERLDPELNAFTEVLAERALAEADAADERRGAGERGAAARGPGRDQGQRRRRGRRRPGSAPRRSTSRRPTADGEIVRRLRAAGAVILAKTTLSELAIFGFTETEGLGRDPQPLGHRPLARRLERRQRRGGRRRARRRRLGHRRRRLDPDPGGVLRPLRAQAAARAGADGAARPLERALGDRLRDPHASPTPRSTSTWSPRAAAIPAGRRPPERPFVEAARDAAGRSCGSRSPSSRRGRSCRRSSPTRSRRALAETEELLRSLGHDVRRHEPELRARRQQLRPALSRRDPRRRRGGPAPGAARGAHPRLRQARAAYPAAVGAPGDRAPRPPTPRRSTAAGASSTSSSRRRVGETAIEVGRWEGKGALRTLLGMSRTYASPRSGTTPASRRRRSRPGFTAEGMPRSVTLVGRPNDEADAALARRPDRGRAAVGGPPRRRSVRSAGPALDASRSAQPQVPQPARRPSWPSRRTRTALAVAARPEPPPRFARRRARRRRAISARLETPARSRSRSSDGHRPLGRRSGPRPARPRRSPLRLRRRSATARAGSAPPARRRSRAGRTNGTASAQTTTIGDRSRRAVVRGSPISRPSCDDQPPARAR